MDRTQAPSVAPGADAIRWIAELGAVTAEALSERLGVSVASARARLSAGRRAGLIVSARPLAGRPTLHVVSAAGLRRVGAMELGRCRVTARNAEHLIACAQVAVALVRDHPAYWVMGERELRRGELDGDRPLASARLGMAPDGGPLLHRPDLVLWPRQPAAGLPIAVEVELTVKGHARLVAICRAWARCRCVSGVLYVAPPNVARAVRRATDAARAGDAILVTDLGEVIAG
jgi:hypothetical protein